MLAKSKPYLPIFLFAILIIALISFFASAMYQTKVTLIEPLILSTQEYQDNQLSIVEQLQNRVAIQPFNLFALVIFVCAIIHTFFAHSISRYAKKFQSIDKDGKRVDTFGSEIMGFMGEVEVIFGLWVIPLAIGMTLFFDWHTVIDYLDTRDYREPMFLIVVMAIASSSPIIQLAEKILATLVKVDKGSLRAWWFIILTLGSFLGSFITEPAAMTICALLLARHFYALQPSVKFCYATLGLLFVNISVGGVLTNFAAPPVLMIRKAWDWDSWYVFSHFGIKAIIGVFLSTSVYFYFFRKELKALEKKRSKVTETENKIPLWIVLTHVGFLIWVVLHAHYPAIYLGSFLLFLGFHKATSNLQSPIELESPFLVGFFLAGLIIHGSLQGWWIAPLLEKTSAQVLLGLSTVLTSFNDNAAVTFLASLVPNLTEQMKYAVLAGAVAGGGLTVIANAPNPAGQSILNKYFPSGISAFGLFLAALFPTVIILILFAIPLFI